jgi:GNAT superfamily N-acetyltransferase
VRVFVNETASNARRRDDGMPVSEAQIEPLTLSDPDGALALSTAIGWNQRAEDWRMLLRIAPAGSFAAVANGRVVGTAIGIDYGRFGWIAMMLVDPAFRGRGLGARLLERAMNALPPTLPIRLDATPLGRPLYRRFGFEDDVELSRYIADAPAPGHLAAAPATEAPIRPLTAADLPSVMEGDRHVFSGDRRRVIEWMMDGSPHYAWVAHDSLGRPQYCFGRAGLVLDQIGPVVAQDPDVAQALVGAALRHASRPVVIDAFDARETFTAWLRSAGFRDQRPLYRMCRPIGARAKEEARAGSDLIEFAILGPEFA